MSKEAWVNVLEENNDLENLTCLTTRNEFFHTIFAAQKKDESSHNDSLFILSEHHASPLAIKLADSYHGESEVLTIDNFIQDSSRKIEHFMKFVLLCSGSEGLLESLHGVVQAFINMSIKEISCGLYIVIQENQAQFSLCNTLVEGYMRSVINEYATLPLYAFRVPDGISVDRQVELIISALENKSRPEVRIQENGSFIPHLLPLNLLPEEEKGTSDNWVLNYDGDEIDFVSLLEEELEDNEVHIRVKSVGINFKDVMTSKGLLTDLGSELGSSQFGIECAGIIEMVGSHVTEFSIGDEVIAFGDFCFTTHLITEATLCVSKPTTMSWETAATLGIAYITAYHALVQRGNLTKEDTILIHSACGGVGLAAINIAKMVGSTIIATAGTQEKRSYLQEVCNIEMVSDSRSIQWVDDVMNWTNDEGVDVILNSLAGKYIPAGIKCLKSGGRMCEIGKRDILENSKLDLKPFLENKSFHSVQMDFLMKECPKKVQLLLKTILKLFESTKISALPTRSFSIFDYKEILSSMGSGMQIGKIAFSIPENPSVMCIQSKPVLFQPRFSYLITGGFGGIGQQFLRWIVNEGKLYSV